MINRKMMLTQAIKNGFDQTSEGYPDILKYCKEKNAYDYTIYGNCGKNLLPYPFEYTTKTINGITFTDNGDGTVTANGTATATAQFFPKESINGPLLAPGTYTFSGCPKGGDWKAYYIRLTGFTAHRDFGNGSTFTLTQATRVGMSLTIVTGATVENLVFKPQIESGSTKTDYEPYKEVGDLDAESGKYILPVTVSGKNMIPYLYRETTKTVSGVTFTDNGDGSITVNGTATNLAMFLLARFTSDEIINYKKYIIATNQSKPLMNCYILWQYIKNNNYIGEGGTGAETIKILDLTAKDYDRIDFFIAVLKDTACENITLKPQLELGETATDFEPYTAPKITNLLLDAPLGPNESVNYKADNLPALPLFNNTSIIMTKTEVPPSNISVTYNTKVKGD